MSHAAGEAGFVKGDLSGGQRIEWSNWAFFIFIFFHFLKALLNKREFFGPQTAYGPESNFHSCCFC